MTTTTRYQPVTIERLDRDGWDSEEAKMQGAWAGANGFVRDQLAALPVEHPCWAAWEQLVDEVEEETDLKVRDLFFEALSRRLPFRWEPEE